VTFFCNSFPLDIKEEQTPPNFNYNHNINCHDQYKNTWCRDIILRNIWTYLKILTSPVLLSFSRSRDHPVQIHCHKPWQLAPTVGQTWRSITSRSMTSMINTSYNESLFGSRRQLDGQQRHLDGWPLHPNSRWRHLSGRQLTMAPRQSTTGPWRSAVAPRQSANTPW
jgi:hypothetical protein